MSEHTLNILMLGGAKRVSMGKMFIEAGRRRGIDVRLFSYELDKEVPVAEIAEVVVGRRWTDPDLMADLRRTVREKGISMLVPFVDGAVAVARRYCDTYADAWCAVCSTDLADRMFDKVSSAQLFESLRLEIPRTMSATNARYPIIAKPRRGSASKGIKVIASRLDLSTIPDLDQYLLQEYVEKGVEYTVDCYVTRRGEIVCAVPRRRLEVVGGEVSSTITVADQQIEQAARHAITSIGLTGAVTVQFIHDVSADRLLLMEINPRLGGGAVCSVHAGADIPGYMIDEYCGEHTVAHRWEAGVKIVRYMQEVVFKN